MPSSTRPAMAATVRIRAPFTGRDGSGGHPEPARPPNCTKAAVRGRIEATRLLYSPDSERRVVRELIGWGARGGGDVSGLTLSKTSTGPTRPVGGIRKWWHSRLGAPLLLEITIVVTLLLIYKAARLLAEGDHAIAVHHALQVIDFEKALGVFNEENAQALVLKSTAVIKFLNVYYLWAHFSVTIAMLVWLYVKKPLGYLSVRRVLVVVTALGLVGHALYPLAPPRMLNGFGFVDTARVFGPNSYGNHGAYGNLANQFAAMPSLHFAWAVILAWGIWR